jgi:hypothetical protein
MALARTTGFGGAGLAKLVIPLPKSVGQANEPR